MLVTTSAAVFQTAVMSRLDTMAIVFVSSLAWTTKAYMKANIHNQYCPWHNGQSKPSLFLTGVYICLTAPLQSLQQSKLSSEYLLSSRSYSMSAHSQRAPLPLASAHPASLPDMQHAMLPWASAPTKRIGISQWSAIAGFLTHIPTNTCANPIGRRFTAIGVHINKEGDTVLKPRLEDVAGPVLLIRCVMNGCEVCANPYFEDLVGSMNQQAEERQMLVRPTSSASNAGTVPKEPLTQDQAVQRDANALQFGAVDIMRRS